MRELGEPFRVTTRARAVFLWRKSQSNDPRKALSPTEDEELSSLRCNLSSRDWEGISHEANAIREQDRKYSKEKRGELYQGENRRSRVHILVDGVSRQDDAPSTSGLNTLATQLVARTAEVAALQAKLEQYEALEMERNMEITTATTKSSSIREGERTQDLKTMSNASSELSVDAAAGKSGWLTVRAFYAIGWRTRWAAIHDGCLLLFARPGTIDNSNRAAGALERSDRAREGSRASAATTSAGGSMGQDLKATIPLRGCRVTDEHMAKDNDGDGGNNNNNNGGSGKGKKTPCFSLSRTADGRGYYVRTGDIHEHRQWVEILARVSQSTSSHERYRYDDNGPGVEPAVSDVTSSIESSIEVDAGRGPRASDHDQRSVASAPPPERKSPVRPTPITAPETLKATSKATHLDSPGIYIGPPSYRGGESMAYPFAPVGSDGSGGTGHPLDASSGWAPPARYHGHPPVHHPGSMVAPPYPGVYHHPQGPAPPPHAAGANQRARQGTFERRDKGGGGRYRDRHRDRDRDRGVRGSSTHGYVLRRRRAKARTKEYTDVDDADSILHAMARAWLNNIGLADHSDRLFSQRGSFDAAKLLQLNEKILHERGMPDPDIDTLMGALEVLKQERVPATSSSPSLPPTNPSTTVSQTTTVSSPKSSGLGTGTVAGRTGPGASPVRRLRSSSDPAISPIKSKAPSHHLPYAPSLPTPSIPDANKPVRDDDADGDDSEALHSNRTERPGSTMTPVPLGITFDDVPAAQFWPSQCTVTLPADGGIVIAISGRKHPELVFTHARMHLLGQSFWKGLMKVASPTLVRTAKMTMHPVTLCPNYLDAGDFVLGEEETSFSLAFGTGDNGTTRVKAKAIAKKLLSLRDQGGDPPVQAVIEYGSKKAIRGFKKAGVLLVMNLTPSALLGEAESSASSSRRVYGEESPLDEQEGFVNAVMDLD